MSKIPATEMVNQETVQRFYYQQSDNLATRIATWKTYGTNPHTLVEYVISEVEKLKSQPENWLDVGCGTGALLIQLASTTPTINLYGLDLSEAMVALVQQLLPQIPPGHIIRADAMQTPFKSDMFHLITAMHVVHHIGEIGRFFQEMNRLLLPGGRLVVTAPHQNYTTGLNKLHYQLGKENGFPAFMLEHPASYLTVKGMKSHMKSHFVQVKHLQYRNQLEFTEVEPAMRYYTSAMMYRGSQGPSDPRISPAVWSKQMAAMRQALEREIEVHKVFVVPGNVDVFICRKKS